MAVDGSVGSRVAVGVRNRVELALEVKPVGVKIAVCRPGLLTLSAEIETVGCPGVNPQPVNNSSASSSDNAICNLFMPSIIYQ
jgi:hypothetical protein